MRDICSPEVPLLVATAYLAPVYFAISSSKISTYLPTDETKVESMHSFTYFFHCQEILAHAKEIKFLDLYFF